MISSLKVYGAVRNGRGDIREEELGYLDIDSYKNCYAVGKRAMETVSNSYVKQYALPVKLARPSYIYGASTMEDDRVWAQFLANIIRRQNILLKSNGAAYRSFCYVTDTASALLTILLQGEAGRAYNIAAEHSDITIRDFAKTAVAVFPERKLTLAFANPADEAEPVLDFSNSTPEILNSERLQALGWSAKVPIAEGIRRAVGTMEEREGK
jgi:nucleoside-diphosphate-sugar epimerase